MITQEEAEAAAEAARAKWVKLTADERRALLREKMVRNPPPDMELGKAYIEYVATVSPDWMAMSFPAAMFLAGLCADRAPEMVADFGSGFSSYVLRRYAKTSGAQVVSVDTDTEWLARTGEFLDAAELPTDDLITWDAWLAADYPRMDLAFHDMASGDLREQSMPIIADRMQVGGVIVFDDAQHESHMGAMSAVARDHGWSLACLPETMDGNGRFDAMTICRASSTP